MKIESGRGIGPANATSRAGTSAAPGFAPTGVDAPQKTAAAAPVQNVAHLDALLLLQGAEDPTRRRARQARRGRAALDALEQLEQGLLLGRAPGALRTELERLRAGSEPTGEADLDAVLLEIDTRVAVELAKLERQQERT